MVASLALSGIAGSILFLLLISGRLLVDPGGERCLSNGYAYLTAAASMAAGLFVVVFFKWFKTIAESLWNKVAGRPARGGNP